MSKSDDDDNGIAVSLEENDGVVAQTPKSPATPLPWDQAASPVQESRTTSPAPTPKSQASPSTSPAPNLGNARGSTSPATNPPSSPPYPPLGSFSPSPLEGLGDLPQGETTGLVAASSIPLPASPAPTAQVAPTGLGAASLPPLPASPVESLGASSSSRSAVGSIITPSHFEGQRGAINYGDGLEAQSPSINEINGGRPTEIIPTPLIYAEDTPQSISDQSTASTSQIDYSSISTSSTENSSLGIASSREPVRSYFPINSDQANKPSIGKREEGAGVFPTPRTPQTLESPLQGMAGQPKAPEALPAEPEAPTAQDTEQAKLNLFSRVLSALGYGKKRKNPEPVAPVSHPAAPPAAPAAAAPRSEVAPKATSRPIETTAPVPAAPAPRVQPPVPPPPVVPAPASTQAELPPQPSIVPRAALDAASTSIESQRNYSNNNLGGTKANYYTTNNYYEANDDKDNMFNNKWFLLSLLLLCALTGNIALLCIAACTVVTVANYIDESKSKEKLNNTKSYKLVSSQTVVNEHDKAVNPTPTYVGRSNNRGRER